MNQKDIEQKFGELLKVMAQLRSETGCPWDKEQTHTSLKPCLLEETYELLDALDDGDPKKLREELGDVLLQVVFHSQIATEEGRFSAGDVISNLTDKLVRRHPHIFDPAGRPLDTPGEVHQQWEQIKAREQADAGERRSVLRGVPKALPSLLRAHEISSRVAAVGFEWAKAAEQRSRPGGAFAAV